LCALAAASSNRADNPGKRIRILMYCSERTSGHNVSTMLTAKCGPYRDFRNHAHLSSPCISGKSANSSQCERELSKGNSEIMTAGEEASPILNRFKKLRPFHAAPFVPLGEGKIAIEARQCKYQNLADAGPPQPESRVGQDNRKEPGASSQVDLSAASLLCRRE
jgi:hypothetical protein